MHTWPNLLAALHWFVELLVFYESRINIQIIDNEGQIRFDELYSDAMENNEQKVSSLIMDVTVRAYEQWLIQNIVSLSSSLSSHSVPGRSIPRPSRFRGERSISLLILMSSGSIPRILRSRHSCGGRPRGREEPYL